MNIGKSLKVARTAVTSKAGLTLLKGQKHSPTLLFAAGVVGFGATVFLASKATLKLDEILEENERKQTEAHTLFELGRLDKEDYTAKDYKKDLAVLKIRFVKDLGRLYAPAAIVGIASVGALTGSHVVLNRRYTSVVAAYTALDTSIKEYRGRVAEAYGEDVDKKLWNGTTTREIVEEGKNGPNVRSIEESAGRSAYAKLFCKDNTYEWSPQAEYNLAFLRAQQQIANDNLNAKGFIFLNDVYKSLGLEPTSAGQMVGWYKDNPKDDHDNYVDFGIFDQPDRFADFMAGKEGAIWLDFNVDGVIYELISKK